MSTGRRPACSLPRTGFRSAQTMSPLSRAAIRRPVPVLLRRERARVREVGPPPRARSRRRRTGTGRRMAALLRGDIVWADLNPVRGSEQAGLRPVLILSADVFNRHSGTVVAVALTTQAPRAGFPLALPLSDPKLPKKSWVKIGQIRTLSTCLLYTSPS